MNELKALVILKKLSNGDKVTDLGYIDEAITELEALQEPKTCDGCAWDGHDRWSVCASCSRPSRRDFYSKDIE